ncbi:ATP-binding protein [Roseofilum casamattae]|uniref:histidine kinase n=1 Tax=Roseofilum casamattae BLCC-M143 TaxID=3022442 RepID=A0ABT7BUW3_9CYAN|nr:ATP-binding protein [Roseofilum casamattae]MDJ1182971.1 ATP-binding protein [Roseofilum casamattae BLCC-M143]
MRPSKLPLRYFILALILGFGSLIGAVVFWQQFVTARERTESVIRQQSIFTANQAAGLLEYQYRYSDGRGVRLIINQLGVSPNLMLAVLVDDRDLVVQSTQKSFNQQTTDTFLTPEVQRSLQDVQQSQKAQTFIAEDRKQLWVLYPVGLNDDAGLTFSSRVGVLALQYNLATIERQIYAEVQKSFLYFFLMLSVLSIGLWLLFSRVVISPLQQLTRASEKLRSGHFDIEIDIPSGNEIGNLAQTFNTMAEQLKSSFAALARVNVELEQRVKDRTAELEVAKEKADAANQAKSSFIANMSHELRSPLNAILGFTQIMTRSQTLPPEHQESVGIINRSGEHLLTLINNVLDLSKIEAGRITLNEKNFDLHRLLDDIHDMFQLKANDKGLQLLLEPAENLPRYIRTDEVKLRQILINLINNALKFTQQGGISIRVSQQSPLGKEGKEGEQPTTLQFEVEDTGAGIAPEELDKLFEAFTQTASGKQAQEGTGLGLSISRKFTQLMGGEMRASSRVGEGTTFSFEIQCLEVDAADVEALNAQRRIIALEPGQPRYRLLIVDDKPVNRQLLIHLLSPLGFELREASNGKEAVEMWEQWEPHLIWMDMRMPVMDGFTATQKIKATTQGQATAIVALTASVLEEERAVVLSAGCDDFLRKPFRDEQIFNALEQHLGVRYVYEENVPPPSKDKAPEKEVLTAENLQALSPELQLQLRQAVISASKKEMTAAIAAIEAKNPALSEAIATCFHNFEYDKILHLIPKTEV